MKVLNKIIETIRSQRVLITSLDRALNNLEAAVESRKCIDRSEYFDLFDRAEEKAEAIAEFDAKIAICARTVNTQLRILAGTVVVIPNEETATDLLTKTQP